jgi:hypothetical protein
MGTLRPCPFCGGKVEWVSGSMDYSLCYVKYSKDEEGDGTFVETFMFHHGAIMCGYCSANIPFMHDITDKLYVEEMQDYVDQWNGLHEAPVWARNGDEGLTPKDIVKCLGISKNSDTEKLSES